MDSDKKPETGVKGAQMAQVHVQFKEPSPRLAGTLFDAYAEVSEFTDDALPILKTVWYAGAVAMFNTIVEVNTGLPKKEALLQMELLNLELTEYMKNHAALVGVDDDDGTE